MVLGGSRRHGVWRAPLLATAPHSATAGTLTKTGTFTDTATGTFKDNGTGASVSTVPGTVMSYGARLLVLLHCFISPLPASLQC